MIRVQRELEVGAQAGFELFCEVKGLPEWVPELISATILSHHVDGRAATVEFVASRALGRRETYVLRYAYDRQGLRVKWGPVAERGLRGYAHFEPITPSRSRITYVMDMGELEGEILARSTRAAAGTLEAFEGFVEARKLADPHSIARFGAGEVGKEGPGKRTHPSTT